MTLLIIILAVVVLFGAFWLLFARLSSPRYRKANTREWLESFSLDCYAPMERLLDRSDFAFLASQPGYRPEIATRLLASRRRAFKRYLRLLIRDFNRLHALARLMLVYSAEERPGLAGMLLREQLKFYSGVLILRVKVALYPLGWTAVDVPKLLHALERMRGEISPAVFPQAVSRTAV